MALPLSLACRVSYHLGCMFFFLLCVLREFAPLVSLAMDTQKHRQGKQDEKRCGAVCVMFLSGEELTMTPHTFLQASPLASRVASGPAGDTDRPCNGHKTIWVPAVPVLGVLACKPRNKQRMPFKGACVSLGHVSIIWTDVGLGTCFCKSLAITQLSHMKLPSLAWVLSAKMAALHGWT